MPWLSEKDIPKYQGMPLWKFLGIHVIRWYSGWIVGGFVGMLIMALLTHTTVSSRFEGLVAFWVGGFVGSLFPAVWYWWKKIRKPKH